MADNTLNRRSFLKASAAGAAAAGVFTIVPSRAFGANDRIRVGLIGVGARGSGHLAEVVNSGVEVEIVAVCETWNQRREAALERVNAIYDNDCRGFTDYRKMLEMKDLDAVTIGTPDFQHTRQMIDAIKAGKHVFCEKPMGNNIREANEALDVAKNSNSIIQIGTQRRSDGRWRGLAQTIQSGVLGKISRIDIAWNDRGPRWKKGAMDITEADVDWDMYLFNRRKRPFDARQYREWHLYREFTNGTLSLLGVHFLDTVTWIMQDPYPTTAVGSGGIYVWNDGREHEDTVTFVFEYPSGFTCRYTSSFGNEVGTGLKIYGTGGMFSEDTWKITGDGGVPGKAVTEAMDIPTLEHESHMANWLKAVRDGTTPSAPIETGHWHTVASALGYQALREGRKLKYLPDQRRVVRA